MQRFEDRWLTLGAQRLRYWAAGEAGTPVLLLHGIGCSVTEWDASIGPLAQRHRVVALDLPGFGRSDAPGGPDGHTPAGLARTVLQAAEALGLPAVHLVGNSLGARVALDCAIQRPDRVASLLLADAAGVGRDCFINFRLATVPLLGELLTRPSRAGLAMLWRLAYHDPARLEAARIDEKLTDARRPGAQAAFLKTLRSFLGLGGFPKDQVAALQAAAARLQQPTLIVWGAQDHALPAAHGRHLASLMPNARFQAIADCGHLPQLEQPQAFNQAALDFWQALASRAAGLAGLRAAA